MTKAVVDIFELVDVDEHDRGALGVALEPRHAVVNRGQEIAAVEQRRQRVALGHALQLGDGDLQYAVFAAQGVAFPAYLTQLVLDGVNGHSGELVDRDPCPPYAIHASSRSEEHPSELQSLMRIS